MKTLGGWLLLLAVAVGMGYAIYVLKFSGASVATFPIEAGGGSVSERALGPVPLEPGMSPVRANLSVALSTKRSGRQLVDYEVSMHDAGGARVWREDGSYRKSGRDSNRRSYRTRDMGTSVQLWDVASAGDYRFEVALRPRSGVDLKSATLDVRRNVATFDFRIVTGVAVLGVLGILLAVIGGRSRD